MSQITLADGTISSVNTNTNFVTVIDSPNVVPMTCTSILSAARTAGSRAKFLETYMLQGTQNTNLKVNLELLKGPLGGATLDPTQDVTQATGYSAIDSYLTTIQDTQIPVLQLVSACLSEANTPDMMLLKQKEEEYEDAKARYEGITTDVQKVSYYEGWFPIFRPMKESSLFILYGVSITLILFSLLFLLQMSGIVVNISFPTQFFINIYNYFGHSLSYYEGYAIGGAVVGIIFALVAFLRGWF